MKKLKIVLCSLLGVLLLNGCGIQPLQPNTSLEEITSIVEQPSEENNNTSEEQNTTSQEEISEEEEIVIDGINIDYNGSTTVTAGSTLQLRASLSWSPQNLALSNEQKEILWTSNAKLVATVDQTGLVNFISFSGASATPKQVTIKAESSWGFCSDEITFTVNPASAPGGSVGDTTENGQIVNYIGSSSANIVGWNSLVAKAKVDGTKSFKVTWEVDNTYTTNDPNNQDPDNHFAIYYNWVTEIFSADPDWGNGGITVRNDWCGWGDKWTIPEAEKSGADFELYKQMLKAGTVHAKIEVSFYADTNKINIAVTTTSSIVAGTCNSLVVVNTNGYKGPMWVTLGGEICTLNNITLTLNSGSLV